VFWVFPALPEAEARLWQAAHLRTPFAIDYDYD
jgi:hypothetical protein